MLSVTILIAKESRTALGVAAEKVWASKRFLLGNPLNFLNLRLHNCTDEMSPANCKLHKGSLQRLDESSRRPGACRLGCRRHEVFNQH